MSGHPYGKQNDCVITDTLLLAEMLDLVIRDLTSPHPRIGNRSLREREAIDLDDPLLQPLRDECHAVAGVQEALEEDHPRERQLPDRFGIEGMDQRAPMEFLIEHTREEAVPRPLGVDHLWTDLP